MSDQILDEYSKKLAAIMQEHEARIAQAQEQFEKTVETASLQLESILGEVANPPAKPKPEAVVTTADDGEQLLVMNSAAVEFMNNMFNQLQDVLKEVVKLVPNRGSV